MSTNFLGIVDETIQIKELGDLILHRSVGAIPFLGRYRLIDFPLSCFRHANVTNVAIFTKGKYRSLQDHLGSGKQWDLDRKRDGLFFLPNIDMHNCQSKVLCFDQINEHIGYLLKSKEEYVVITNTYVVTVFDYQQLVDDHIRSQCDITEVYQNNERLNIYVLKRKLLIELVLQCVSFGYKNMVEVIDLSKNYKVGRYEFSSCIYVVRSIRDYFNHQLRMLNLKNYLRLFKVERPIITKSTDTPPAHFKKGAKVKNSILANGINCSGTVENSVVSRSVKIGNNAYIKNAIINHDCIIGDNCVIENAILDKECIIAPNVKIIGKKTQPVFLRKYSKIANYNL